MIDAKRIPLDLRLRDQWVMWRNETRGDRPTKVPYQPNGEPAKSNDPATWSSFNACQKRLDKPGFDGLGYMFSECDEFCGVDLDGCRNPETGQVAEWAREIVLAFDTYAEISPSKTGLKLFFVGRSPFGGGKKKEIADAPRVCDKTPGIEVYDQLRYFAVTGHKLQGPAEPQPRQEQVEWLKERYWPEVILPTSSHNYYGESEVCERARKYLAKLPPAVSGSGGHNQTFRAACVLVLGFGLGNEAALSVLREWNQGCQPPWSERELIHKIESAGKQGGERNYLRNLRPEQLAAATLPTYQAPPPKPEPKLTTLTDAAKSYIDKIEKGQAQLVELGLGDVDYAIGGGVEPGEMVVIGARPSHGKSAIALQCVHTWTRNERKCLIVSEEMSALMLGKRTLQYITEVPREHWDTRLSELKEDIDFYETSHSTAIIAEQCGTTAAVVEAIDRAVAEHKIEAAVVDYAQLLRNEGKSRYEQVTNTSIALKAAAKRHGIVLLLLAQLSREIEHRPKFAPVMSDLKESGQIEQDADVILFLVWPHRIDSSQPANQYTVYVAKNRNREINQNVVDCCFLPSRQMLTSPRPKDHKNYDATFDDWNERADLV